MIKQTVTLIVLITFSFKSFACKCPKLLDKWDEQKAMQMIESSDIIFIGKLKTVTKESYEFEVVNAFKGAIKKGDLVNGYYLTSCSGRPYGNGKWIFYGRYFQMPNKNDLTLHYSQCSPTRNLINKSKIEHQKYWEKELSLLNRCFDTNITDN